RQHDGEQRHAGGQHPREDLAQDHSRRTEVLRHPTAQRGDGHRRASARHRVGAGRQHVRGAHRACGPVDHHDPVARHRRAGD
ncbi:hypothetical protein C6A85_11315, partial [Mycobacterium sp. ITM-2017-0098]